MTILLFVIGYFVLGSMAGSARFGTKKLLKAGLEMGIPPDSITYGGTSAIVFATEGRQVETVKLLLSKGADIRKAVLTAADLGDIDMLNYLAKYHPLATLRYEHGRVIDIALLHNADQRNVKTCTYLIRLGANPNYVDPDTAYTPLTIVLNSPVVLDTPQIKQATEDTIRVLKMAGARADKGKSSAPKDVPRNPVVQ